MDYLIIGAGISGLTVAWELSQSGAEIAVVDQGELARESSWAGGGILSPLYPWRYPDSITALARWSQQAYARFCQDLAEQSGIDPEYQRSGLLIVAPDEEKMAFDWAKRWHYSLEKVDARQAQALEPHWSQAREALWLPEVAQVRNPRLTQALIKGLQQRGVRFYPHHRVLELLPRNHQIQEVRTERGTLSAKQFILCAGAWSKQLHPHLQVQPVKGQMILWQAEPGMIQHMVLEADRYIIPRRDGLVLFGSSLEPESGFDRQTDARMRAELEGLAKQRFAILKHYKVIKHWAGLRPAAPQGIPYIGQDEGLNNLWFNTGHYRNGVVLALASARLLADLILGRSPILSPAPYGLHSTR